MNPPSRLPFLLERLGTDNHGHASSSPPASSLDASALLKRRQARQAETRVGQAGRAGGKQPRRLAPESALERLAASIIIGEDERGATAAAVAVAVAAPAPPLPVAVGSSSLRVLAGVDPRGPRVFGEPRAASSAAAGVSSSSSRPVGAADGATATATIRVSSASGNKNKSAPPPPPPPPSATAAISHMRFPPGKEHASAVASIAAAASQLPSRPAAPAPLPTTARRRHHRPEPRQHLLEAAQQQHFEQQQQQQDDPPPIRLDEYYSHYDDGAGTCDGDALGIAGSGEGGMGW